MSILTGHAAVLDIDGTQVPEGPTAEQDFIDQADDIRELKDYLGELADHGLILVLATNRMFHLYEDDHDYDGTGHLVRPHYVTTTASTEIWKCDRETGNLEPDPRFNAELDKIDYDKAKIVADVQALVDAGVMVWSSDKDQTAIKTSAKFVDDVSDADRHRYHQELQAKQSEGVEVFLVHGGDEWIIDVMPEVCTKDNIIAVIADEHGISSENIFVAGNSTNDISMFKPERSGVAVSDAKPGLKEHVETIRADFAGAIENSRLGPSVAPDGLSPAASVLWGLKQHFGPLIEGQRLEPAA